MLRRRSYTELWENARGDEVVEGNDNCFDQWLVDLRSPALYLLQDINPLNLSGWNGVLKEWLVGLRPLALYLLQI